LQLIDCIIWHVRQRKGRDVTKISRGVIWLQRIHLDLILRDAKAVRKTFGEVVKDLLCRSPLSDNKGIV